MGFQCESGATEKINKLLTHDDAYMDVIMQMIQDYGNIQVDDEEEMELDIDNLNVNCLNELDKFVTKSNNDIRRKNAKERAKQRRNERRRQERARKLREQQEEAEQQRMQQRQQQMQMSCYLRMFGNSASNNSSSLLNSGAAPSTQQNKTGSLSKTPRHRHRSSSKRMSSQTRITMKRWQAVQLEILTQNLKPVVTIICGVRWEQVLKAQAAARANLNQPMLHQIILKKKRILTPVSR